MLRAVLDRDQDAFGHLLIDLAAGQRVVEVVEHRVIGGASRVFASFRRRLGASADAWVKRPGAR
jgi:hypothetical protein